jgi:tRNA(fMet)-specific endonuclease VapC
MFVLDTDHLGEYQKGTSPQSRRFRQRIDSVDEPVATTIITVEEIMRGWMAAIRRETDFHRQIVGYTRLQRLFGFIAEWDVLPWDEPAVRVMLELRQSKVRVGTMDLKIASIALARDATLLTRNTRDFSQVPNLRIDSWLD